MERPQSRKVVPYGVKIGDFMLFAAWSNPRGGGTLVFSCIRRLGSFFFCFKILNFNTFWVFQKNEYFFFGNEDFVDIFWGHHKIGLYLRVISMHFWVFS